MNSLDSLASGLGLKLFPWQKTAARYLTAIRNDGRPLYREVAIIVARQNGKTTLLVPLIVSRLLGGNRIMHTAQNRVLPREVFEEVADLMAKHYPRELAASPRFANGQEEIRLRNGGRYRIVAPTRGGARGPSNDLVLVDELREFETTEFIAAAKPTLTASKRPQFVYTSNAGTNDSVVLNALRSRATTDKALAYLEWSADPQLAPDSMAGWLQANPSIGHLPGIIENLEAEYRANSLGGTMAIFETEHLCRWATSLRRPAFRIEAWTACRLREPLRDVPKPFALGIGVAPGWERATIVVAAVRPDGRIGAEVFRDLRGEVTPQTVTEAVETFHHEQWAKVIAYDSISGGAGAFERHAQESGLRYDALKPSAMIAAQMDFSEIVTAGRLAVDDPLLDAQLPNVVRRMVGPDGAFRFDRSNSTGPIDAIEATALAVHAIAYRQRMPKIT